MNLCRTFSALENKGNTVPTFVIYLENGLGKRRGVGTRRNGRIVEISQSSVGLRRVRITDVLSQNNVLQLHWTYALEDLDFFISVTKLHKTKQKVTK